MPFSATAVARADLEAATTAMQGACRGLADVAMNSNEIGIGVSREAVLISRTISTRKSKYPKQRAACVGGHRYLHAQVIIILSISKL